MSNINVELKQKLSRIDKATDEEMGPRQKRATECELDRTIKIAGRTEEFYDIKEKVVNTIIFTTAVIEIIFMTAWFMNKYLYGLPAWLLSFKYLGAIVLSLWIFANPITDKIKILKIKK